VVLLLLLLLKIEVVMVAVTVTVANKVDMAEVQLMEALREGGHVLGRICHP
jgi:hypothetical protein